MLSRWFLMWNKKCKHWSKNSLIFSKTYKIKRKRCWNSHQHRLHALNGNWLIFTAFFNRKYEWKLHNNKSLRRIYRLKPVLYENSTWNSMRIEFSLNEMEFYSPDKWSEYSKKFGFWMIFILRGTYTWNELYTVRIGTKLLSPFFNKLNSFNTCICLT